MIKTEITNGAVIPPEWFRAMQTPSYSRAENEVGHLPLPDGYADLQQWKTFNPSASALDVSGWTRNAIVLPTVWLDSIAYSSVAIKNAIMIVAPKWASAGDTVTSCTFAQPEGSTVPILRGNILIVQFGADGKISSYFSLPAASEGAIASFGKLTVSSSISFPAGSIVEAMLAAGAVSKTKIPAGAIWPKHLKELFFSLAGDVYAMFPTGSDPDYVSLLINALAIKRTHLSPDVMVAATTPIPVVFNYDGSTWAGIDKSFLVDLASFGQYLEGVEVKTAVAAGDVVTAKIWVRGAGSLGTAAITLGSQDNYVTQVIDISSSTANTPASYTKSYAITADDITRGWIQIKSSVTIFDGDISVNLTLAKGA